MLRITMATAAEAKICIFNNTMAVKRTATVATARRHRRHLPNEQNHPHKPKTTPAEPPPSVLNAQNIHHNATINSLVLERAPEGHNCPVTNSAMAPVHRCRTISPPADAESDALRPAATHPPTPFPHPPTAIAVPQKNTINRGNFGGEGGGGDVGGRWRECWSRR